MAITAVQTKRLTEAGNIKESPGRLHWLAVSNPDNDDRYVILNDAIAGTGGELIKLLVKSHKTEIFPFSPALPCSTGIRIGTFNHTETVVLGGYSE